MLSIILLVFAFVFFVLAIWPWPASVARFNLVAAGLACWVLTQIIGHLP